MEEKRDEVQPEWMQRREWIQVNYIKDALRLGEEEDEGETAKRESWRESRQVMGFEGWMRAARREYETVPHLFIFDIRAPQQWSQSITPGGGLQYWSDSLESGCFFLLAK